MAELVWKRLVLPVTDIPAAVGTYTRRSRSLPAREVRLIVLHAAQCGEVVVAAESLGVWLRGPGHPKDASWNLAVDVDSITRSVDFEDVAWHAGAVNGYSIGIEQAGKSEQTAAQWADPYSEKMLDLTAKVIAVVAGQYDLPIEHVTRDLATARGVCTHKDVQNWFHGGKGHWDPGPNYPMERVLRAAREHQLWAVS